MSNFLSFGGSSGEEEFSDGASSEEELEVDDTLGVLDRLKKYSQSENVLHRLHVVREISDSATQIGAEATLEYLLPLLDSLQNDGEPVIRQALVEQLPPLAKFLLDQGGDSGHEKVLRTVIPIIEEQATDSNPQVRQTATAALVGIATLLKSRAHMEENILPIVFRLANDHTEEEHRVEASQLLHNLAPILGKELCIDMVIPEVAKLSRDPMFRVRKAVAGHLGNICQTIEIDATIKQVLPLFLTLAQDEIWGVRKACAEGLVTMSQYVTQKERSTLLVDLFEKLAEDPSRWVRSASFQNLGPFIATFEGASVPERLLGSFTVMAKDSSKVKFGDADTVTYCAFNFPAVLATVGKDRWALLQETYFGLVKDLQWKVRRPLAHSLHEIARLLGTEMTEQQLLPTFELFLKDLPEVKVGVVKHLAEFLGVLSPASRAAYLPLLAALLQESESWRFRKLLAKQMGSLCKLFPPEEAYAHLVPLAWELFKDQVAMVRRAAASQAGPIIDHLASAATTAAAAATATITPTTTTTTTTSASATIPTPSEEQPSSEGTNPIMLSTTDKKEEFVQRLVGLSSELSYVDRQMYVQVCVHLARGPYSDLFRSTFMARALALVSDRVPNVRLLVAELLNYLRQTVPYSSLKEVQDAYTILCSDRDRDVRHNASATASSAPSATPPLSEATAVSAAAASGASSADASPSPVDTTTTATSTTTPEEIAPAAPVEAAVAVVDTPQDSSASTSTTTAATPELPADVDSTKQTVEAEAPL